MTLGSLAGYYPNRWWSEGLEKSLITVYPVPYYILAFVLLMAFTFYLPIFPLIGGARGTAALTWEYISSVLYHGFLPALSIVIGATAHRFIMAKALTTTEKSSDYVQYAQMAALPERKILFYYVTRNTLLPQVTDLSLSLGALFGGALIAEFVFGYPGLARRCIPPSTTATITRLWASLCCQLWALRRLHCSSTSSTLD